MCVSVAPTSYVEVVTKMNFLLVELTFSMHAFLFILFTLECFAFSVEQQKKQIYDICTSFKAGFSLRIK